jgi:hypothetical protein
MYFYGQRYLWDFGDSNDAKIIEAVAKLFPEMAGYRPKQVEMEVKYWRKANQIHKWFVDNIQEGKDECQETYVDPNKLRDLQSLCARVVEDPSLGPTLLPSSSGFFFGNTEYDEYYLDDVRETLDWLNDFLLKFDVGTLKGWDFYYRSSW